MAGHNSRRCDRAGDADPADAWLSDQRERAQDLAYVIRDAVTKPITLQQIRETVSDPVEEATREETNRAA